MEATFLRIVADLTPFDMVVWAAAGFKDTLLRCEMKSEVFNGNQKEVQPIVQA